MTIYDKGAVLGWLTPYRVEQKWLSAHWGGREPHNCSGHEVGSQQSLSGEEGLENSQ